jgi:uncharacterized protein (TIGR00251 family)
MILTVKVKPQSKKPRIAQAADGSLVVYLASPPVDGRANEELIEVLAEHFNVRKAQVRIKSGLSGRNKIVEIIGI